MPHNWNESIMRKGAHPSYSLSKNTNEDGVDVVRNKSGSSSSHDDALLLASFADTASKVVSKPVYEQQNVSPVLSNNVTASIFSCQFPTLPTSIPNTCTTKATGISRPRAISYSPNEVHRSIFSSPPALSHIDQQTQRSLAMKPQVVTNQLPQSPCRTILRKKFSWKHYPPLEDFLIANREEYLRHSTLNYTLQQKKYNNMLTEQMIQLASQHRLVFDKNDFSFVTVRDRIRCYYKSYVQSLKKRGIVCGYAARKAGLISKEEMNKNAATKAKIFVPN